MNMAATALTENDATRQGGSAAGIQSASDGVQPPSNLFTTLLVAQIRNQNPLEPADPSAFVSQLTQLSQMEALQKLATQSGTHATLMQSLQAIGLGAQVGSEVSVQTDRITLGSDPLRGSFNLGAASSQNTLVLRGPGGVEHRIALGSLQAGESHFEIDPVAAGIPAGSYDIAVQCASDEATAVDITGLLQSLRLSPTGTPVLSVAAIGDVPLQRVSRFNGRPAQ